MRRLLIILTLSVSFLSFMWAGQPALLSSASAAAMDIESLPQDHKAYRKAVKTYLGQVDGLIKKLKANQANLDLPFGKRGEAVVLELISLRDITQRELEKFDFTEHGKFTVEEVRESVDAALRLLNERYEQASGYLT